MERILTKDKTKKSISRMLPSRQIRQTHPIDGWGAVGRTTQKEARMKRDHHSLL